MKPLTLTVGPFTGMRDALDVTGQDRTKAATLQNLALRASGPGTANVCRTPYIKQGTVSVTGTPQCVVEHRTAAGTQYTFVMTGTKVWRRTSGSGNFADVTPVGITFSNGVTYAISWNGTVIVSDGVNKPWYMTDATTTPITAAYITKAAGAWYGPPTVYYAKLFGILASDRQTIEWSEESDQTTGYNDIANGFANFWLLSQTSSEPLTALRGTNEALYYWRRSATGAIRGPVSKDFVNAGTHDSIDQNIGSLSPRAIVAQENDLWFLTQYGAPAVLSGARVTVVGDDCAESTKGASATALSLDAWGVTAPEYGYVLFAHPGVILHGVVPGPGSFLVMDAARRQYMGKWTAASGNSLMAGGLSRDSNGREAMLFADDLGAVWAQPIQSYLSSGTLGYDYDGTTYTAIPVVLETPVVLLGELRDFTIDRMDVQMHLKGFSAAPTHVLVSTYRTNRADYNATVSQNVVAQVNSTPVKVSRGLTGRGRTIQCKFTNAGSVNTSNSGPWAFLDVTLTARPQGDHPSVP